ncbi:putative diguanylate phosphodiesterase [Dethiosulfovibrio peptidovorans DSM 11002]|uniref:Diguanylate phosphodiesterase n=1 Tax=Dethiosulfovibrio peptidovorans DSM 11002 TaxID=469381 RepID=D2Z6V6_9BACT|nr:hypothetical protein [Dethiosulfovibrio peptidovorans]EFC91203.1 putative diguanylate phosphodiesterase [Dethiosulfovibrio peptidovorans DSM 11002]
MSGATILEIFLSCALEEFLRRNGVKTVFQPVVDFFGAKIWGYEALSRGVPPSSTTWWSWTGRNRWD